MRQLSCLFTQGALLCACVSSCAVTGDAAKDHKVGHGMTEEQIAADTDLSKVTVRRYLNYLIGTNEAESQVDYSTGGRPRVEYRSK